MTWKIMEMAKKSKYIVRVTAITDERVSKKEIREYINLRLGVHGYVNGDVKVSAKASTVDEQ